jgi:DNA-binding XRE family transcriptional regulator
MDASERVKLEAMGYAIVEDAADWLELTEVERQVVDFRVRMGREIRRRRDAAGVSQARLAEVIGSSQSRIAKAENCADGVAIDLLMRAYFATGGTIDDLSRALS